MVNPKNPRGKAPKSPKEGKSLSCTRCRVRKVRCDFLDPCTACVRAKVECVPIRDDKRKQRPAANYVTKLESKVKSLTGFLQQFKEAGSLDSQRSLLASVDLDELINNVDSTDSWGGESPSGSVHFKLEPKDGEDANVRPPHSGSASRKNSIYEDPDEDRALYGPTSVYDDNLIKKNAKYFKRVEESSIKSLNSNSDILHCIKLFFTWQYPDHNMFIFREAFLIDFFDPKPNSLYCSKILILSICALGSKMSDDDTIYNKSIQFYQEAKNLLLNKLNNPSITSLQSFLLLAFYDISNGYNSSGWMLSGSAMRMGFDLGFQLNPEVWFVKSKEQLEPLDVNIRSRIYWGSYVADHFISLLLGRPSLLKLTDASIPETNDLPDLEWIDEFTYRGLVKKKQQEDVSGPNPSVQEQEQSYISNPLNKIINLISISDNMLNDIFTKSELENDQSNHEDLNLTSRLEKLKEYNSQIMQWKNTLPPDLQWDRMSLQETAENPTLTCIRYYYYILVLCLNRPFVGLVKKRQPSGKKDQVLSPLKICDEAIDDLYDAINKFQSVHGFRRVSIFMVYCSILSVSIILLTNTSKQLINEKRDRLQFFMEVLQGSSKTWKLAEKSFNMIQIKLKTRFEDSEDPNEPLDNDLVAHENDLEGSRTPHPHPAQLNSYANSSHHSPVNFERLLATPIQVKLEPRESGLSQEYTRPELNLEEHSQPQAQDNPISTQNSQLLTAQLGGASPLSTHRNLVQNEANMVNHTENHSNVHRSIVDSNTELLFDKGLDFLGGPPVLMTSDLFNEDWESLFPDYMFNPNNT